jgi:hypothetical protein
MRSISQSPWTGCPDLFGILCLDLASAFRHLRDFSTWIGYPNSLPDWVSWILDLLWYLDFSLFFSNCLRDFVCLDMAAANWAFRIGTGCPDSGQRAWLQGELLAARYLFAPGGACQNLTNLLSHRDSRDFTQLKLGISFF